MLAAAEQGCGVEHPQRDPGRIRLLKEQVSRLKGEASGGARRGGRMPADATGFRENAADASGLFGHVDARSKAHLQDLGSAASPGQDRAEQCNRFPLFDGQSRLILGHWANVKAD
eukprot:s7589_g2.t1